MRLFESVVQGEGGPSQRVAHESIQGDSWR